MRPRRCRELPVAAVAKSSRLDAGILNRDHLLVAGHPRADGGPFETETIESAAEQLDLVLAMSEVYGSDRASPRHARERVEAACPELLA